MTIIEQKAQYVSQLLENGNKAVVLYGAPGTQTTQVALHTVCRQLGIRPSEMARHRYEPVGISSDKGCWEVLSMHEGYTYENFVGVTSSTGGSSSTATFKKGLLPTLCRKAAEMRDLKTRKDADHKFIVIIKNIEKVNLSAVFGEMLPALAYRNMLIATPYTKIISIPDNIYFIATMNSDTTRPLGCYPDALKVFSFCHITPMLETLAGMLAPWNVPSAVIFDFIQRCTLLNKELLSIAHRSSAHTNCQIGETIYGKITDYMVRPDRKNDVINQITEEMLADLWNTRLDTIIYTSLGSESYSLCYDSIAEQRRIFTSKADI